MYPAAFPTWFRVLSATIIIAVSVAITVSFAQEAIGESQPVKPEDEAFSLTNDSKLVLTIKGDGNVVLGEDITLDEASKEFWSVVGRNAPCAKGN